MHKKWLNLLLGLTTIVLLSLIGCRIGESSAGPVDNRAILSYSNLVGITQPDTWSDTVQVWVCVGPSMTVIKTSKNLVTNAQGDSTQPISAVPGDTVEITLSAHNVGDTYAYIITLIDTFPSGEGGVGDPSSNSMNYMIGSETCAINGSLAADSISWCIGATHTWNEWQTYDETASLSIPNTCTGIRWRWNIIPSDDLDSDKSWIRVRYKWFRNNN